MNKNTKYNNFHKMEEFSKYLLLYTHVYIFFFCYIILQVLVYDLLAAGVLSTFSYIIPMLLHILNTNIVKAIINTS